MSLNSLKTISNHIHSWRIENSEHNHFLLRQKGYQYFP
jgi:hypothetical protein